MNNATAARIRTSLQAAFEHKLEAHVIASERWQSSRSVGGCAGGLDGAENVEQLDSRWNFSHPNFKKQNQKWGKFESYFPWFFTAAHGQHNSQLRVD